MRTLLSAVLLLALVGCGGGGGGDPSAPVPAPAPEPTPAPTPTPSAMVEWLTADAVAGQVCPVDQSGFRIYPLVSGVMQAPTVVPFNAANCVVSGTGTCGIVWRCSYAMPSGDYQITGYDSFGIESVPSGVIRGL